MSVKIINSSITEDNYEHIDLNIEYILENILFEPKTSLQSAKEYLELKELYNSILLNSCNCEIKCENCFHSQNYKIYKDELVLNPERRSIDLIYECSNDCKCLSTCYNRHVQYGPRKDLLVIQSKNLHNQKGLTTSKTIPKGAFVCEYAGEIITKTEAKSRSNLQTNNSKVEKLEYDNDGNVMNYIVCLNEYALENLNQSDSNSKCPLQTFIDPSRKGNIGRYLNHSCDPNCEIISVRIDNPIPKLGIFTKRQIQPFEELCFHYGGEQPNISNTESLPCLCGSSNCQKYLPNLEF